MKAATNHPEIWNGTDGVLQRCQYKGANLYVKTIQQAIDKSAKKPAKVNWIINTEKSTSVGFYVKLSIYVRKYDVKNMLKIPLHQRLIAL